MEIAHFDVGNEMIVLLLQTFFWCSLATVYSFADADIQIEEVSSGAVVTGGSSTPCGRLVARSNQIYHVGTSSIFQSARKGALGTLTNNRNISSSINPYSSYGVDDQ
jgi:hypothetical protein